MHKIGNTLMYGQTNSVQCTNLACISGVTIYVTVIGIWVQVYDYTSKFTSVPCVCLHFHLPMLI